MKPCHVRLCAQILKGSPVKVTAVVSFLPLGGNVHVIKAAEAAQAAEERTEELDMILNIAALKEGNYRMFLRRSRG